MWKNGHPIIGKQRDHILSPPARSPHGNIRGEKVIRGSLRWALFQFGGLTLLAYLITTIVFQTGMLMGIGV
jgi:hypothetical protein